jgi:hypothetical protein
LCYALRDLSAIVGDRTLGVTCSPKLQVGDRGSHRNYVPLEHSSRWPSENPGISSISRCSHAPLSDIYWDGSNVVGEPLYKLVKLRYAYRFLNISENKKISARTKERKSLGI